MLDYAASHRAQYVVIDERTVPALRPELAYLLDARAAPTVFIRLFRESAYYLCATNCPCHTWVLSTPISRRA
jgi:hypothetical protein